MKPLSRRRFLGTAVAAPLGVQSALAGLAAADRSPSALPSSLPCLLIDYGKHCVLPESLAGFERGLQAASIPYRRVTADRVQPAKIIIVPGALLPSEEFAARLSRYCRLGSTVIYESGAAFANGAEFRNEQRLLKTHLEMGLQAPVDLWDDTTYQASGQPAPLPYIHYHWPARTMVRDFSRALPVYCCGDGRLEVTLRQKLAYDFERNRSIAYIRGFPVARRSRLGQGNFIFLGSPLGPHLYSGDGEAQALLQAVLSQSS